MEKITNIILSSNPIYKGLLAKLKSKTDLKWIYVDKTDKLNKNNFFQTDTKNINKIFIPHWSYKIPKVIYENYECVLFHMTDLPFGRGGSPLQNLIKMGFSETKISALRVVQEIDAGPIYLKENLILKGNATEIFERASKVIEHMILKIINKKIKPLPQVGNPTFFERRKTFQSEIIEIENVEGLYDHIRMLDYELYPKAFLDYENFRLVFENARLDIKKEEIICNVRISKK
mgnify:CR=1 FL=1|tara:strand:- start:40291 stop:40986 length:696 start_codon:yes stop_codon:yes gene_type:complete